MTKVLKVGPKEPVLANEKNTSNSKKLGIAVRLNKEVRLDGFLPNNSLMYRNWMIDEMRTKFPLKPALWHVDKMFPLPNGKKLLVDEPVKQWQIEECEEKRIHLKELNYNYLVKTGNMTIVEALQESGMDLG